MKHLLFINSSKKLESSFERFFPDSFAYTLYLPIYKHLKNNLRYNHVFKSRYILNSIINQYGYHNYKIKVFDTKYKNIKYKKVFIKSIEILGKTLYKKTDIDNLKLRDFYIPNMDIDIISDNINSIHSPYVIETFVTFLLSECVTNNEIHHFPIYYGSFSYMEKNKKNNYESYNKLVMEKMIDDFTHICYEKTELSQLKKKEDEYYKSKDKDSDEFIYKTNNYFIGYIFQILYSINFMWKKYNITHNDLHLNNIMFKHTDLKNIEYKLNNKKYLIPTNNKMIKIIDFGRACAKYKHIELHNSIFNKDGDCYNQYYLSDNNDIHLKSVKPRPINDVIMFLHDLYSRFELDDNLKQFCEKYLLDSDNNLVEFDNDSFDKYINISHINWKTKSIDKILKDKIFDKYLQKSKKKFKKKLRRKLN